MGCMKFDNILVRDTTAWTLGRICELHYGCISGEMLPGLMQLLLEVWTRSRVCPTTFATPSTTS